MLDYSSISKKEALGIISTRKGVLKLSDIPQFANDKEVVLQCVSVVSGELEHASPELRDDWDVVYASIFFHKDNWEFASERIKNNKDMVLKSVKRTPHLLVNLSDSQKNDKEIVSSAMEQFPDLIYYASQELKDDKELLLKAVKKDGFFLANASARLKNDREVVIAAMNQNAVALKVASDELQNDKELLLKLKNEVKSHELYGRKEVWFKEKMRILEIMEDEQWMKTNNPDVKRVGKIKKF